LSLQEDIYTTVIGGIVEAALPEVTKDKFETKTLDQAGRGKGYEGSFYDGGTLSFQIVFDKTNYGLLLGYVKSPTSWDVQLVIPDKPTAAACSKVRFRALFEKCGAPLPADGGRVVCDVTIQVDGEVNFAPSV
jgi:hypothetical protein